MQSVAELSDAIQTLEHILTTAPPIDAIKAESGGSVAAAEQRARWRVVIEIDRLKRRRQRLRSEIKRQLQPA